MPAKKKCFLSMATKGNEVDCDPKCAIYDEINECCSVESITTSLLILATKKLHG